MGRSEYLLLEPRNVTKERSNSSRARNATAWCSGAMYWVG